MAVRNQQGIHDRMGQPAIGTTAWHLAGIRHRQQELEASSWLKGVWIAFEGAPRFTAIRCLALGSVTDSLNSRYQLALLVLLVDHFNVDRGKVTMWDPVFSSEDREIMAELGFTVDEQDFDSESVLWYVPHGPATLNLDLANRPEVHWFVGNNLHEYEPPLAKAEAQRPVLAAVQARSSVRKLPKAESERWFTAFNDTAVHVLV